MSDDIIKRLREALAAGPTVGPWTMLPAGAGEQCVARINSWEAVPPNGVELAHDSIDANYIAAASPDNIAALLDRLDAAEREIERLRAERDEHARWREKLADDLHERESQISDGWAALRDSGVQSEKNIADGIKLLRAENEALAADARRYRWLRRKFAIIPTARSASAFVPVNLPQPTHIAPDAAVELDAAIDAARAAEKCQCDMRTRLVGDGCQYCNPELARELSDDQ